MRFNLRLAGVYGFFLFLAWLSGSYFGSWMLVLFWLLVVYPFLSVLVAALASRRLQVTQEAGDGSPARGEEVRFRYRLVNRSVLPIARVRARLRAATPAADSFHERVFSPGPGETVEWAESYRFPYRGVYRLGLEAVEVSDLLRLARFPLPVRARIFRVYPRVLPLQRLALLAASPDGVRGTSSSRGSPDPTLFSRVREYASGEPIRHIYWKKFAATGVPFLKEYEGQLVPTFTIYPDLRPPSTPGADPREQGDTTVEIVLTLVRHLLDHGVEVRVAAPGLELTLEGGARFPELLERCVEVEFRAALSPPAFRREERATSWLDAGSSILVAHRLEGALLEHLESSARAGERTTLVLNQSGHPEPLRAGNGRTAGRIRTWGVPVLLVDDAESLARNLSGIPDA